MRQLIDADALAKLAHWELLNELPNVLSVPLSDCATLTSVRYRAGRALSKPDRLFRSADAARAAIAALANMAADIDPGLDVLAELQDVTEIDAGEVVLLSALAGEEDCRLLTGDKRCLRALASLPSATRYAGRITIVEQIVLKLLDRQGIEWLRSRICPEKEVDKAIAVVFGSNCDAPEASVREGLGSYIDEIRRLCHPPLLDAL